MTPASMQERYQNICSLEHGNAFFGRIVVIVEGETEEAALPIYSRFLDLDFDANSISIVNASGKKNIDAFYHLYEAFSFPIFVIFDNDRGGKPDDLKPNRLLLRMLNQAEEECPGAAVKSTFAIIEGNFEKAVESYLDKTQGDGYYQQLKSAAAHEVGAKAGKAIIARYMAKKLTERGIIPDFIQEIIEELKFKMMGTGNTRNDFTDEDPWNNIEIPF